MLLFEAFVFVHAEQDEGFLGPRIHNARRSRFGLFQGLHLLFGKFDHGCLPSFIVSHRHYTFDQVQICTASFASFCERLLPCQGSASFVEPQSSPAPAAQVR